MTVQFGAFVFTTLLGSVLFTSGVPSEAEAQGVGQPPEHAVQPKDPNEAEEEKENKKKKKPEQEVEKRKPPAEPPPLERKPQQQQRQSPEDLERERRQQEQQDRKIQQQRQEQERRLQQKRVSQQEQQERIRRQEQQLALYRKNIALQEELAERDAQILRQQKRIQHLRLQQQYEERLRAQRAQLLQARYDYSKDPYYYTAPNYRYRRGSQYYQTNQYGIRQLERALQAGYNEGYRAGRADREDRWRYDPRSAFGYRDANIGYDGRYIAQDEYNYYFREGFQRGYDDGYYSRQNYGRKKDDGGINDEWLIAGAVVAAIIGYQVLTD